MRKGVSGTHYKSKRKETGIYLRLSAEDAEMIRGKAKAAGIPITQFVVNACRAKRITGERSEKAMDNDIAESEAKAKKSTEESLDNNTYEMVFGYIPE